MAMPKQRVVPALRMTDYERSKAYYVQALGSRVRLCPKPRTMTWAFAT